MLGTHAFLNSIEYKFALINSDSGRIYPTNYLEINIIEISKTLGHSTCSTTMNIYAHSFEEQQEEVATKVNEFLRLNA